MSESFDPRRGVIEVVATVEGPRGLVRARLMLDTGAAIMALRPRVFAAIGADLTIPRSRIRIATASRLETASLYIVPEITAIGHRARNIGVLNLALPFDPRIDGLLGLNFLRGRRLTIDLRSGLIELE